MDKYSNLEKLGQLLEKGLITKEEFEIEKKKILGYGSEKMKGNEKFNEDYINKGDINKVDNDTNEHIQITKTELFKKCGLILRPWYINLLLSIITLGIYWFFFIYSKKKVLFLLQGRIKNNSKKFWLLLLFLSGLLYLPILFVYLLIFLILIGEPVTIHDAPPTAYLYWGIILQWIMLFILSIQYILYFKDRRNKTFKIIAIALFIFFLGTLVVILKEEAQHKATLYNSVSLMDLISIELIIGFIIAYIIYFLFIYILRIDYLLKNYLTEDFKIVDDKGNVIREVKPPSLEECKSNLGYL